MLLPWYCSVEVEKEDRSHTWRTQLYSRSQLWLTSCCENLIFAVHWIGLKKKKKGGKKALLTYTGEMNERCIASQIRFVFQSSSGHIPYWLKPNTLITCSSVLCSSLPSLPLPAPLLSLSFQREVTRMLSAHHKRSRDSKLVFLTKHYSL